MKTIKKDERLPTRTDPTPILSSEEQLEPVKLELKHEVECSGEKISVIIMRVPKSRDMLQAQLNPERTPDSTYLTLAKACEEVTPEAIEALHPRDVDYLSRIYFAFQE